MVFQTNTSIVHGCSEAHYKSGFFFFGSDWAMTQTALLWVCGKTEDNKTPCRQEQQQNHNSEDKTQNLLSHLRTN